MNGLMVVGAALMASTPAGVSAPPACSSTLTAEQVVALQDRLFDALGRDDRATWQAMTAPDFLAHERGRSYTRDSFFQLLADAHKSGHTIRWSVTEPRVEADCNLVVLSYVNVGSISASGGEAVPVRWLEMASYRRTPDGWRLFLITSERVAETSPAS